MFTLAVNLVFILLLADIARAALQSLALWCWVHLRPVQTQPSTEQEPVMPAHACFGRLCPVCKGWREAQG